MSLAEGLPDGGEALTTAERALSYSGGDAQVTVIRERSLLSRFAHSQPTQATEVDAVRVSVICVRDGHPGEAGTTNLDDDALRDVARRASAAAEATARAGPGRYPSLPVPGLTRLHQGYDVETAALAPARAGAALRTVFEIARRSRLEASGAWTAGVVETAVASSAGMAQRDSVTDAQLRVVMTAAGGRTGFASGTAKAAAGIDESAVAERAAGLVDGGEPVELPPGAYPVVLGPAAVADLLDFAGGLAFNGLAFAEGRSPISGRLGQRVAAACINLSDSPRFALTLPRAFDAEGVPKQPLPLVQDGVAHAVVHDTRSAALAGGAARSTGHALVPGGALSGPAPTNLVLTGGGAADEEELAVPIERGIHVTRLWYVNPVDAKRGLLTGMTRDGTFLIEDGRRTRPLRDVRFTDEILRILSATQALTAGQQLVGLGHFYGPRFAYGAVTPALRADGFRVTSSTAG